MSTATTDSAVLRAVLESGITEAAMVSGFMEQSLASFEGDQWVAQPWTSANHALWTVGHLTTANLHFARLAGAKVEVPDGYEAMFGMGSEPKPDASAYPALDTLMTQYRASRDTLHAALRAQTDEQLASKLEGDFADLIPNRAHLGHFCAMHEANHGGEVLALRKALGMPRMFG